jgi:hypothetical protein
VEVETLLVAAQIDLSKVGTEERVVVENQVLGEEEQDLMWNVLQQVVVELP